MRLLISDYSGHPFQVQLSRELARRGHEVVHTYSAGFQTPKGNLQVQPGDPQSLSIEPVTNTKPFAKNTFLRRRAQEVEIGRRLADLVYSFSPDIVLSSNAPLDTQRVLMRAARNVGANFVFWLQDIYSHAISRVVRRKLPLVGAIIAAIYRDLEFRMLRGSDTIVAITQDFVPILVANGVEATQIRVIENWAPLNELPRFPRDNEWTREHMTGEGVRFVYSGTLGYKHNPQLLLSVAREMPECQMHVFSEGEVASGLAATAAAKDVTNLHVHPWVAFEDLPKMLSGADIFVAVIEPEAGVYSVPSKVLTYLAIGRPILASVPLENLAARLIVDNTAGYVSPPGQDSALLRRAKELAGDPNLRAKLGNGGRDYAETVFDIGHVTDKFESIFGDCRRTS